MTTIVGLTSAFESLSSMKVVTTKRKVQNSNIFFSDVWDIYKNIRVQDAFLFGRGRGDVAIDKELYILITAPAGLSGDIDQRLIRLVRKDYNPEKQDIIVIGKHGAQQLQQSNIAYKRYFALPKGDEFSVDALLAVVKQYRETRVFYQSYVSMMTQDVRSMRLRDVIETRGAGSKAPGKDVINEVTYIFEPNALVVAAHMETSMMRLALMQMIYDSRLAQYASRFKAMTAAKQRAVEEANRLHMKYNKAKRTVVDTRLKEISAGLKKIRQANSG